ALERLAEQYQHELDAIESRIHARAGERFNVGSPKQLQQVLFEKLGLPVVSSPHLSMVSDHKGEIDLRMSSVTQGLPALPRFLHQVNVEMEYMKAFRPDVVVSDTRLSSVFAANLLGVPTALILNQFQPIVPRSQHNFRLSKIADGVLLTLIGRGWAASDIILIPDFPEPYTISLESLRIPKPYRRLVRLVGSILPRKPEEVAGAERVREEVGADEGRHLIFAAISGPEAERLPIIARLKAIFEAFPDDYRVVMSMGMPNGGSEPECRGPLTVVPWVRDRFKYLKACDLVVSRAGHETIMQSICFEKPMVLVPTPGHTEQYGNARRAKELGVAEAIHQRDLTREELLSLVEGVLGDDHYVHRLHEINSKNSLGDGVENSVAAIGELLHT
ncbi:MAG: DNA polymerase, partial [Candidatus Bathyarchaeia archaeon]